MDNNGKPQNSQNNIRPQPNEFSLQNTSFTDDKFVNDTTSSPQNQSSHRIIASGDSTGITISTAEKSEKMHNIGRVLFVFCFFALVIGSIMAVLYFTKSGIFGEKRISTGNHSFIINENNWQIDEINESDYSITLTNNNDNVMLSITDNPLLSDYQYDEKSVAQALGAIGSTTSTKKTSGNIDCIVYDTDTSYQGVSIQLKSAVCNIANDYNAAVSVASQNNSILEKYLNEGIEILQTGQK